MWIRLNDKLVEERDARVSVFDRGFLYGDGAFETMRAYSQTVFCLKAHLDRLTASAGALRIDLPRPREAIASDIQQVLDRNGLDDAVVRVTISRGRGPRGFGVSPDMKSTYIVAAEPLPVDVGERQQRGVSLKIVDVRKVPDAALPARAKHSNYLNSVLAHLEARDEGADDGLMLSLDGYLAEGTGSNLFFVTEGQLCTPSLDVGILGGIARAEVLKLAEREGIETREAQFVPQDLLKADEAFLTNSVVEILPVRRVDTREYPAPGVQTDRLRVLLTARIHEATRADYS